MLITEIENNVKIKLKGKHFVLDIKVGDVINDEETLVEMVNSHYVNIVENSTGVAPIWVGTPLDPNLDWDIVEKILKYYENHSSTIEIKKLAKTNENFTFPKVFAYI